MNIYNYFLNKFNHFQNEILISIIALTAIIVYLPILGNDFVYDDYFIIVGNPAIQATTNPIYFFTHPEAYYNSPDYDQNYRPIGAWILSLEFSYFQFNPKYYHALSVILHALNSVILFFILKYLFESKAAFAFLGSLIFLIHPVQTEAVAFAAEHTLLWASFFCFLTILLILKKDSIPGKIYYLYIPLFFITVFTKDQFVVLPILLTAVLWFLGLDIKKYLAEIAVASSTTIIYIILRAIFIKSFTAQQALWGGGIYPTFLTMSNVFTKYISLIIKGYPLTINYDDILIINKLNLETFFAISLLASFVISLFLFYKKAPLVSLGIAWFFISLLTVANFPFPLNSLMNERFLYPALPGIIIAVFSLLILIERRINILKFGPLPFYQFSLILTVLLVPLLIYYGTTAKKRLYDWRDEEALWGSAAKISPSLRNKTNYAKALGVRGEYEEALKILPQEGNYQDYLHRIKQVGYNVTAVSENHINDVYAIRLAGFHIRFKKINEAENVLKKRYRESDEYWANQLALLLGKVYLEEDKYEKALGILPPLLKKTPDNNVLFFNLLLFEILGRKPEDAGLMISEEDRKNIKSIANAYLEKKKERWQNVYLLLLPTLAKKPIAIAEPYLWLAEAEEKSGKFDEAEETYWLILKRNLAPDEAKMGLYRLKLLKGQ